MKEIPHFICHSKVKALYTTNISSAATPNRQETAGVSLLLTSTVGDNGVLTLDKS